MFPGGFYGSQANGLLDEVRIWNVARTEAQIAANKDGELTGPQTGLVGYWPMNEGTGLMLHDVSGSGRDVDLTSAGYTSASWTSGRYSVASIIGSYRYAFNGKEIDQDIGEDDYDYGMRIYDARLGKFISVDPLTKIYPHYTPYSYAGNKPIAFIDLDGAEEHDPMMHDDMEYLSGKMTEDKLRERQVARGMGGLIGLAIITDVYITKGKATQFILSAQVLGAFEHKRATTPEGRAAQDERSKAALADAFFTWGTGKILGIFGRLFKPVVEEESYLFRGTTVGYQGNRANQIAGVTPTSTDPIVATIVAQEATNKGEAIIYIANARKLPITNGNVLDGVEKEVAINMQPVDFPKNADLALTLKEARGILKSMGRNIPNRVTYDNLTETIRSIPALTKEEISTFVEKAIKVIGDRK